jgi:hypothetical protein
MDNWNKYSVHVLEELKRLNTNIQKIDEGQRKIERDIVKLQTKSTVWGAIGGFIISGISSLFIVFLKK